MEVGQKVYIVPYDSRYNPFYSNVIKIGKKYITIDNLHPSQNKFRISDFKQEGRAYTSRYKLYKSKEYYQKELSERIEYSEYLNNVRYKISTLSLEQLKETFDFISKY